MMNRWLHIVVSALTMAFLLSFAACQRRDLFRVVGTRLRLDLEVDTTVLHGKSEMPELMIVAFYASQTGALVSYEFMGVNGGWIRNATPGKYDMLVYNFNTTETIVSDERNFHTALAYSNISESRHFVSEDRYIGPVIDLPEHLYVGRKSIELKYRPVYDTLLFQCGKEPEADSVVTISQKCVSIMDTYHFIAKVKKGLSYISRADVYITGQSKSNLFGHDIRSEEEVVIHFPVYPHFESNTLEADFVTFGAIPGKINSVYLEISSSSKDKASKVYSVNVTDQFLHNEKNGYYIIIDPGIEIEPGEGDIGGLDPKVDDWEDVEQDLPVPSE